MVFSSMEFLFLFLPVFLMVYYLTPHRLRNLCLLLFSLGFYGWGSRDNPAHFLLLILSVLVNYRVGLRLGRCHSRFLLSVGLVCNFGILFAFKYSHFALSVLSGIFGFSPPDFQPALPIGISFYTFQAVSYLFDVYRRRVPPEGSLVRFGTYITMFPQLVAGPIVRYQDIRQRLRKRRCGVSAFFYGMGQFIAGLGLKVLLANRIGRLWETVCGIGFDSISTPMAWMGILSCSLQLYFDFWGYSQMAIGLGRMIGFSLPVNFRHPYQARSMTEFWRRWHITLGAWFREYVYIPLGGNRCGKWKTVRNLLIVWLLTGIWHGAGWNYLLWGLFLFTVIAIEKAGLLSFLRKKPLLSHIYMLMLIPFSWLLFSVTDPHSLGIYLLRLLGLGGNTVFRGDYIKYAAQYGGLLAVGILFCTPIPFRVWDRVKKPWATVVLLLVILFTSVYYLYLGLNDPFLYFSF